jgi:hypothetical protein
MTSETIFLNEDQTVRINGPETANPIFFSLDEPFSDYVVSFNKYKCKTLAVMYASPKRHLDLSGITQPNAIRKMLLQFGGDDNTVKLPKGGSSSLSGLVDLQVKGNAPKELFNFRELRALKSLEIEYDTVNAGWREHEGLIDIKIHGFKETNLSSLAKMKSLRRLCLVGGEVGSLDGIESLGKLETLHVVGTKKLASFGALARSKTIHAVAVGSYKKITDWSFLATMKQLEFLSFDVADSVAFVSQLPNLKFVVVQKIIDKDNRPIEKHVSIQAFTKKMQATDGPIPIPFYERLVDVDAP